MSLQKPLTRWDNYRAKYDVEEKNNGNVEDDKYLILKITMKGLVQNKYNKEYE